MIFIPIFVTDSVFIELQNKQIRTMDRKKMKRVALGALICAFSLSSCADKDVYQGGEGGNDKNTPLSPTEAFDFNMKQEVKVNVDYGFTNDYYIVFELYSQNPMKEEDGSWVKDETLSYIYSASTDKKGKYSGSTQIASDIKEVWLYTDYLGAISPVKITISDNGEIKYNQADYIASLNTQTRGVTNSGHNYLDDWMLMPGADWDIYGLPSNIEPNISMPSAATLYSIKEVYSMHVSGKYATLNNEYEITVNELQNVYSSTLSYPPRLITPDYVLCEDSNSGLEMFHALAERVSAECHSAHGKSNIPEKVLDFEENKTYLIIVDGAAYGSEMGATVRYIEDHFNCYLYAPESFEWLLLKVMFSKDPMIYRILKNPSDYTESTKYLSWERYFTHVLEEHTKGTELEYHKKRLNKQYLYARAMKILSKFLLDSNINFDRCMV